MAARVGGTAGRRGALDAWLLAAVLAVLAAAAQPLAADYRDAVGYTALRAELGEDVPTGAGVVVAQVEGMAGNGKAGAGWAPDPDAAGLEGKLFPMPSLPSDHATMVGLLFYGKGSMSPGIAEIECYPSDLWASDAAGVLRPGTRLLPLVSRALVANHSYVGAAGDIDARPVEMLKRLDYLVSVDDFVQVAGVNNAPEVREMWQCAYNAIIVGRRTGRHASGTLALGAELYGAGRAKPDLMAPMRSTSEATPLVASAAALLIGFAHSSGPAISRGSYVSPRSGRLVYHAETSEVIKAALMAGAERMGRVQRRSGRNPAGRRRADGPQNGLDARFGAGQLNVRNSYYILAAGEQDGVADSVSGNVDVSGFDYNPAFGGLAGTPRQVRYRFTPSAGGARLSAVLVWNLKVNEDPDRWDGRAELYDLDLKLFDLDVSEGRPVATSDSWVDNVEGIWAELAPGHTYELRVVSARRQPAFRWDYALAWQVVPDGGGEPGRR